MEFKLFKDSENNVYSYPVDGSQDHLIGRKTNITKFQADAINEERLAPERQKILDSLPYGKKRSLEYPPMADFVDATVKGDEKAMEAYRQTCLAVKAKYPKDK